MTKNDKLLTISVAAYNVEDYVSKTLESCIAIDEGFASRLDVIVVNDGSSDATSLVAHKFESRYPNIVRVVDKSNGGYGSTINHSLSLARGKFFRCLDGDDWFDPSSLELLLKVLERTDAEAVYTPFTHCYEVDGRKDLVDCLANHSEGIFDLDDIVDGSFLALTYLTFRTDCLRKINLKITEGCFYTDCEFAFLPFQIIRSVHITHLPLYCYRIGRSGQSISIEGLTAHYRDNLRVCSDLVKTLAENRNYQSGCLFDALAELCTSPYSILFKIPPDADRKTALIQFDRLMFDYPKLYFAVGRKSKKAWLARITNFTAYRILCLISGWGR